MDFDPTTSDALAFGDAILKIRATNHSVRIRKHGENFDDRMMVIPPLEPKFLSL